MVIHLASDHAGFEHKQAVFDWLIEEGFEVVDHGAEKFDPKDDFPDYILQASSAVSNSPELSKGIIFGGSGQGEAMAANLFSDVRATAYYSHNSEIIKLSREHNDSNILSIGARFLSVDETKEAVWAWLHTEKSDEKKYARRIKKVEDVKKKTK